MDRTPAARRPVAAHPGVVLVVALVIDLALVGTFVLIGRASHDEDPLSGALTTFWPFAAGVLVGWLLCRAWRRPLAIAATGIPVWAATVVAGLVLRALSDQGVQTSFAIVTAIVLGIFLVGWRGVASAVLRVRRRRTARVERLRAESLRG